MLYPALAQAGQKAHAGLAHTEQSHAKMQMAELENIAPSSKVRLDKLEHFEGAVLPPWPRRRAAGSWILRNPVSTKIA